MFDLCLVVKHWFLPPVVVKAAFYYLPQVGGTIRGSARRKFVTNQASECKLQVER